MHNCKYRIPKKVIWYLPLLIGTSCAESKEVASEEKAIEVESSTTKEDDKEEKDGKSNQTESPAPEEDKQTEEVPEVLRRLRELTDFIQRCNSITPEDAADVCKKIALTVNEEIQPVESVKHMCQEVRSTCRYFVYACSIASCIAGVAIAGGAWYGIKKGLQHAPAPTYVLQHPSKVPEGSPSCFYMDENMVQIPIEKGQPCVAFIDSNGAINTLVSPTQQQAIDFIATQITRQ